MENCVHRKKVEELTQQVKETGVVEKKFAQQIQAVKDQTEQRERQLSIDYAEKLAARTAELSALKQQFVNQLADVTKSKTQWRSDKELEITHMEERLRSEV